MAAADGARGRDAADVGRQLGISAVVPITSAAISEADARRAGCASLEVLLVELDRHSEGELYRIELGELRLDARVALRDIVADGASETEAILRRLGRLDAGAGAPWTRRVLELVQPHSGVRAGDLCTQAGLARELSRSTSGS